MRKTITVVAVLVVLAVIGVGASRYLNSGTDDSPAPRPTEQAAPPSPQQPEWCPRVEFISAPGTWESAADDDPLNPSANPRSFMLSITKPLQEAYGCLLYTSPSPRD